MADPPFLLFVCHANICRSPMAERLVRMVVTGINVGSAGTHALAGEPMHPGVMRVLREAGAGTDGFASRELSARLVAGTDLVLAATREQRAICVSLSPPAVRHTFTIRQFGRLAAAVDPGEVRGTDPARRLASLLDGVTMVRGKLQPVHPDDDDLADPVNGTEEDLRVCARLIQSSLFPALEVIGAP